MPSTKDYAEYLVEVESKTEDLQLMLSQDFGYKFKTVLTTYSQLFDRFCPYKIGDRVQLTKTSAIEKKSGWYSSRHFLIKGSIATVESCDFRDGLFWFNLAFDDESWIDDRGEARPASTRHTFGFSENFLESSINTKKE